MSPIIKKVSIVWYMLPQMKSVTVKNNSSMSILLKRLKIKQRTPLQLYTIYT
jgi:hypothetical protein